MDKSKKAQLLGYLFRAAHASGIYFIFIFINRLCRMNLRSSLFLKNVAGFWNVTLYGRVGFVFSLLLLFSLLSIFTLNDYHYKLRTLERTDLSASFLKKAKGVITDRAFIIEAFVFAFWVLVLPINIFWTDLLHGFYNSPAMLFVVLAAVLLLVFVAHVASVNWWLRKSAKTKKGYDFTQKDCMITLIKQFVTTAIIYPIAAVALSVVCPVVMTFWNVAAQLGIALFVILAVLIFVTLFSKWHRLFSARKKLIKGLKRLEAKKECTVEWIKKPYSSSQNGINICLRKNNVRYFCKLIGTPRYRTPLYLYDEGYLQYTKGHSFLGIDLFYHEVTAEYFFEAEGEKILIVVPESICVISTDGKQEKKLYIGDKLMDYSIYDSQSFINAIERDCL